jgi:nifR3 family TIM-barrel protein
MNIGGIEIKNNVCLAPMAGVTDLPFRLLCREQGCGLVYTEMVSAKAILYNNRNTGQLLQVEPGENPIAVQLFGSDPAIMADIAKRVAELPFDIIDVNMGCPVPKVVNNGEGSALMKNPVLVGRIVEAMANAVDKPVTVKIRKGFNDGMVNAPEIAHVVQESGGACVAVHGRTREQYYSGNADWDIIRQVKERVTIPVIGNGDIRNAADVERMMAETGCDGVMVGRAARGNPWIFSGHTPTTEQVRAMILRHARLLVEHKGEFTGIREMRKHFAWYTAGCPNSAALRNRVNYVESMGELEALVMEILK